MNNIKHKQGEFRVQGKSIHKKLTTRSKDSKKYKAILFSQPIAWLVAISIIVGFFWIQVKLDQLPEDWAHTALLYISVIAEFGLLGLLNQLMP